ncbi:GNAT family acetyltransferase [Akkermansiaceae bacterium]|nr:GNAT family acetyltransferase [Akkermansiaceae bacterium]
MQLRSYEDRDQNQLIDLWRTCNLIAPVNDPFRDIEQKMKVNPEWFLDGILMASCMFGYNGHRAEINYLAVHPDHQGKGFGREMMLYTEKLLLEVGCPKINIMIRNTNLKVKAFYESLGYVDNDCLSLGKRLTDDE